MCKSFSSIIITLLLPFLVLLVTSCDNTPKQNANETYLKSIQEWDKNRTENLRKKDGWLNLAGLFWLNEGENKFGSSKENHIIFPEGKADEFIGSFILEDGRVTVKINENVEVKVDEVAVSEINAIPDVEENTTLFTHKSLAWFVIVRSGGPGEENKIGIRLRDYDSELVKTFPGVERFPVDTNWIVVGKYVEFESPKKIIVPNIIGTFSEVDAEGEVVFEKDGNKYSLIPTSTGERFFFVFADLTSGEETYGAGRFLYTEGPDENGNLSLDFNKAYNPPCAFTKYATCPLPPKENHLKLAVTAGEKNWGNH